MGHAQSVAPRLLELDFWRELGASDGLHVCELPAVGELRESEAAAAASAMAKSVRLRGYCQADSMAAHEDDEDATLAAVQRNSALIMPYMNKPAFIDGSWRVLLEMMPEADALEVVTKNPGILASNPAGLAMSDAETIKRAAGFVDGVENVLDGTVRKLFKKD